MERKHHFICAHLVSHLTWEEGKKGFIWAFSLSGELNDDLGGRQPAAPAVVPRRSFHPCLLALQLFYVWPEKLNQVSKKRLDCLQQAFNTLITLKALGIIFNVSS